MNVFNELKRFREDRGLDKNGFDIETYLRKDLEEMAELLGFDDKLCDLISRHQSKAFINIRNQNIELDINIDDSIECKIDALGDRIVYAIEAIEQLGYDAEKVMLEVSKEINSREGEIVNGKFQKFKTPEAKAKWYIADFTKAKK